MNWFKDVKVSTKLMGSFAIVAAIAALIGWMGLAGTRKLAAVADDIYQNQVISIAEVQGANNEFLSVRMGLRDMALAKANERPNLDRRVREHFRAIDEHLGKYKPTISSEAEKKLVPEMERNLLEYKRVADKVSSLLLSGDENAATALMA